MQYWLMKSEPECFSIDDLYNAPNKTNHWDGVRNYQARNFMLKNMQIGDRIFFYHSNCKVPAIVGVAKVSSRPYPDHTAWDPNSEHYDPKSPKDNPRWFMVDITFEQKFKHEISLQQLKLFPELQDMLLLRKGNRLSITPVSPKAWQFIIDLANKT